MSFNEPFGAPSPAPAQPVDEPASPSLHPLVLGAAAVGGAALLGAATWFFVLSGPDATEELAAGLPTVASTVAPSASASASPTVTPEPLPPVLNQELRDPFKALIVAPAGGAGGGGTVDGAVGPVPSVGAGPSAGATTPSVPTGGSKPRATGPVLNPTSAPTRVNPTSPVVQPVVQPVDDEDAMLRSFGQMASWEDGLSVSVSNPAAFTPSADAIAAVEPHYRRFEVTVTNAGTEPYQPAAFTVLGLGDSGKAMTEVIARSQGLVGNPTAAVGPGQQVTFSIAYGTESPEEIALVVLPGFNYITAALFTNVPLSELDPKLMSLAEVRS